MLVYQKVRAYIEENNINQMDIVKQTGIPADSFNLIMAGNKKMYADELRAICLALNVSPETFISVESEQ